jgi:hypothetical protein
MMSLMWLTPDHSRSVIRFRASEGDVFSEVEVDGDEGPIQGDILGDPLVTEDASRGCRSARPSSSGVGLTARYDPPWSSWLRPLLARQRNRPVTAHHRNHVELGSEQLAAALEQRGDDSRRARGPPPAARGKDSRWADDAPSGKVRVGFNPQDLGNSERW